MKKSMSVVLAALLVLLTFVNCFGAAAEGEFDFKKLKDGTVAITAYNGSGSNVVIPGEIDGKKVSAISEDAFSNNKTLKSIAVSDGIESIGKNAFNNCIYLEKISLSSSLKEIGENAFFTCTALRAVEIPETVEKIGTGAFFGCNEINEIVLPSSLRKVGDYAFSACLSLKEVRISEGLTKLSNQMFSSCENLESVVLPESVREIGRRAFYEDHNLLSINLPKKLDLIDENAFSACFSLSLSEVNAKTIEKNAFSDVFFETLTIGSDTEKIGTNAISSGNFESVYIPKKLTDLSAESISCSALKEYRVDSENPNYTSTDGVLFSKNQKTLIKYPCAKDEGNEAYIVPETVKTIGDSAFLSCTALSEIVLPEGLESIGDHGFEFCSALKSITLPNSVSSLGVGAFSSCSELKSAVLSDRLEEIKEDTFSNCDAFESVTFGKNLKKIGNNAFSFCMSLKKISLPKSIKDFNTSAFSQCDSLESFEIEKGAELVLFGDTVMNAEKTKIFAYFGSDQSYTVPETVKTIGELAIMPTALRKITIPESVENFGKYAVGYCISYGSNPYEGLSDFRIFGKEGSKAQEYAKENVFSFYTAEPKANAESVSLKSGETFDFFVDGTVSANTEYASSNSKIASVDKNGKVTANKNGTAEIFAVIGKEHFKLSVTVTGGEDYVDEYSSYRTIKENEVESWSKDNLAYNGIESISVNEYYNTNLYTSELYIPIMAHIVGGSYEKTAKENYGEDYGQYKQVGDNLRDELSRMKLSEDTVLFSGTDDISYITHSGSSITDMLSSVGTTHTYPGVISTSVSHGVAAGFGTGMTHTMLEIYADKDSSDGVYIADVSVHPDEYELLLTRDLKYEVLDAGVRSAVVVNRFSGEEEEITERFIKLHILPQEPQPEDNSLSELFASFIKMLKTAYKLIEAIVKIILQIVK
ncbi:MAG: leucine-rich repeat protein [Clostridia bacterium]|nr:leucine-rich repeat protein [Clostridia bacterium]